MSIALEALESALLQAGHARVDELVDVFGFSPFCEKDIVTRVFRLRGCEAVGEEPGQIGESLREAEVCFPESVEGVREGTQKAGRVGFAAYEAV